MVWAMPGLCAAVLILLLCSPRVPDITASSPKPSECYLGSIYRSPSLLRAALLGFTQMPSKTILEAGDNFVDIAVSVPNLTRVSQRERAPDTGGAP